ncbi:MAG TPA: tryptophan synthase subunit alpha, partial [Mobilitalea sp.]|nr:tryptophan synthase subunit alpha [Mobilitalea sp.]
MNRIDKAFTNGKAFIPFITAGDPSLDITEQLVLKMASAGADLIELGIPFSDPVAEGPIIQGADYRALAAGTTTDKIFDMVDRIRKVCDVPIAFMTYANPIFTYGTERFMKQCQLVGVDALIVPDIPYEEKEEL